MWSSTGLGYYDEVTIGDADDLVQFSKNVNNGDIYFGTTVYLSTDIDLTNVKNFEPIGKDEHSFQGTFDGQGFAIKGLKVGSTSQYAGLFGLAEGATIRNVVIDSQSSVTTITSNSVFVGSVVGQCHGSGRRDCVVENCVNMGKVYYSSFRTYEAHIGGIVGCLSQSAAHNAVLRNSANYGSVMHLGTTAVTYSASIGGVVGSSSVTTTTANAYAYVKNVLNYGTVYAEKPTSSGSVQVGGIIGKSYLRELINCVSSGNISVSHTVSKMQLGSIVGYDGSSAQSTISHCFWTPGTNVIAGFGFHLSTPTITETYSVKQPNRTVVEALNKLTEVGVTYNKWLLNANPSDVVFFLNGKGLFSSRSTLIMLPSTANTEKSPFYGWFTDNEYETPFTETSVTGYTKLYGKASQAFTVLYIPMGGTLSKDIGIVRLWQPYNDLPTAAEIGYMFGGWFTDAYGKGKQITSETIVVTAENHILYANWIAINYTLTLDYSNGTLDYQLYHYNDKVTCPDPGKREGYRFVRWSGCLSSMPAMNITATAIWEAVTYGLTFDYGYYSETIKHKFGDPVQMPEDPTRYGYKFVGWDSYITTMPAHDTTTKALWKKINNK